MKNSDAENILGVKVKYLIALFLLLFLYNGIKFWNMPESDKPIVSTLFSLILLLSSVVFLFHKKDLLEMKCICPQYKQEKLDRFLKKIK